MIRFPLIEYYSIIRLIKVRATDNSIVFNINCVYKRTNKNACLTGFYRYSAIKWKTNTHNLVALRRIVFSIRIRTCKLLRGGNGQALPKEQRIIYFYTIRRLHFKRASIYEINDNLSAEHGRISEKGRRKG